MDVILLTIPAIDWNSFLGFCKKHLEESPTRILDAKHIAVGDLCSFMGTINVLKGETDATKAMRAYNGAGASLLQLTFAIVTDCEAFTEITNELKNFVGVTRVINKDDRMIVVSTSIASWVRFCTVEHQTKGMRQLSNQIWRTMMRPPLDLQELVSDLKQVDKGDQTFNLRLK